MQQASSQRRGNYRSQLHSKEQHSFYQNLYAKDPNVNFTITSTGKSISQESYALCAKVISFQEILEALKSMKNSKAPGLDGLPVEVYKLLWKQLGPVFYEAICECYRNKKLYQSARKGVLNLIPKSNRDTRLLKNLRPITLLNSDYKLIDKCIAKRLDSVLGEIINSDQTGFMKKRRISVNIRKFFDLISYCERNDIDAIVLSIDFMKCFDLIDFSAITGSLKYFNFPQYLIDWIVILYEDFTIQVQNNGYLSEEIKVQRSVHQGGCTSSFLFLCCAEVLANELRGDSNIKGIPVDQMIHLLNQFADDADITSLFDTPSLQAIISKLDFYHQHSGFTVNYDKTSIMRIGSLKHSSTIIYTQKPIAWTSDFINGLGVKVSNNNDFDFSDILTKTDSILQKWGNRSLSLIGKISVINTLIGSLYVYRLMVYPNMKEDLIRRLESKFSQFIWNGKKPQN